MSKIKTTSTALNKKRKEKYVVTSKEMYESVERMVKYSGIKLELRPELKRLEVDYDKFVHKKQSKV